MLAGKWWEWRCCGWLWELIPTRARDDYQPECPTCGGWPKRETFRKGRAS